MATPVPPDMSGMLSDLQQRSDRPSGTRSCNDLATPTHQISRRHQIGARSHESERQTSRRGHGGSPQPRIASQAWTVYQDLRQDVDAVAKAKDFEDAPPRKRKRVAACCGVSGLTLAAALFSVLFFFFALQRTGLWSLGRRTADHDVLSIQDIKRGIIDWAMHWQVGLAMYDSWRAVAFAGHWPADNPSGPQRKLGLRVQLRDVASGKYVRMLTPGEASVGDYGGVVSALVADKDVPWLHGGTFEVIETDTGGWELVTRAEPSAGKWLETHGSGGGFWRPEPLLPLPTPTPNPASDPDPSPNPNPSPSPNPNQAASGGRTGRYARLPAPPETPTRARGAASGCTSGWAVPTTRQSARRCSRT